MQSLSSVRFCGVAPALDRQGRISLESETGRVWLYILDTRGVSERKEKRTNVCLNLVRMLRGGYLECEMRADTQEKIERKERMKRRRKE